MMKSKKSNKFLKERIVEEYGNIIVYLEDLKESYFIENNHFNKEHLFDEITKYRYYKLMMEQILNDFPMEVGSY